MNKALNELLEKAKAVRATNDALIESFQNYVQKLLEQELNYEYISDKESKENLRRNSALMSIYEARLNRLSDDENFNHFCRYVYLQIEGLLNFYIKDKFKDILAFKEDYKQCVLKRFNKACEFDFLTFLTEYSNLKEQKAKGEDAEYLKVKGEFETKYSGLLKKFVEKRYELKVYLSKDEVENVPKNSDFSVILKGAKEIKETYSDFDRIPYSYKFEYFLMNAEIPLSYKIIIDALTDFRNKELSHIGEVNHDDWSKNTKSLKERKNFIAIKEALSELNKIIEAEGKKSIPLVDVAVVPEPAVLAPPLPGPAETL
jgi:hypothetical protein